MPLTVDYDELRRQVGYHAGYGNDPSAFDATQIQVVEDAIANGLREFYFLRRSGEKPTPHHVWSFLVQTLNITALQAKEAVELPEDFSRLNANLSYGAGVGKQPVGIVTEFEIRTLRAKSDVTGAPKYCAIRSLENTEGGRSRYEMMFYPTPDVDYPLIGRYTVEPPELSSTVTTPLGGALHSQTIIEACLSAVDKILNPEAGESLHSQAFERLLAHSIEADKTIDSGATEYGAWPLDADSTDILTVNKKYLRRIIGQQMHYGPNVDSWSQGERSEVAEALRTGLRRFYNPPVLPGEGQGHEWSFLRPVRVMDLIGNQSVYLLPEDFAALEGSLTFAPGEYVQYDYIRLVGEEKLRHWLQGQQTSGRPCECAIRVRDNLEQQEGTRYELIVAPVPDQNYQVQMRYRVNATGLGEDSALPLGGQPHAQTVVESCLWAAEERAGVEKPRHERLFMMFLHSSIGHDRDANSPDSLGYNNDRSDRRSWYENYPNWHDWDENIVTFNGVEY